MQYMLNIQRQFGPNWALETGYHSLKNRAFVNADECVECYSCFRGMSMEKLNPILVRSIRRLLKVFRLRFDPEPDVCPTSAITPDELSWPRILRRAFSDPIVTHESTGVHGRGTEEEIGRAHV